MEETVKDDVRKEAISQDETTRNDIDSVETVNRGKTKFIRATRDEGSINRNEVLIDKVSIVGGESETSNKTDKKVETVDYVDIDTETTRTADNVTDNASIETSNCQNLKINFCLLKYLLTVDCCMKCFLNCSNLHVQQDYSLRTVTSSSTYEICEICSKSCIENCRRLTVNCCEICRENCYKFNETDCRNNCLDNCLDDKGNDNQISRLEPLKSLENASVNKSRKEAENMLSKSQELDHNMSLSGAQNGPMVGLVFRPKPFNSPGSPEHRTTVRDLKVCPDNIVRDKIQPENKVSFIVKKVTKKPKSRAKLRPKLLDPPVIGQKVEHLPAENGEIEISDIKLHE